MLPSSSQEQLVRSQEERNALVVQNLRLVPWTLFRSPKHLKKYVCILGWEEAMSIANLALIRAAGSWQPHLGTFSNYAVTLIRWKVVGSALREKKRREKLIQHPLRGTYPFLQELSQCLEDVWRKEICAFIQKALQGLSPRSREIIVLRYGLDGQKDCTLGYCAKRFGVTKERIRSLQAIAIRKLSDQDRKKRTLERLWEEGEL